MVDKSRALTLLEIIAIDWRKQGGKSKWPTKAFIATWRAANKAYAGWNLSTVFAPHSTIALRPLTRLDRATQSWLASGHSSPMEPGFDAFLRNFSDAYTELGDEANQ